MPGIEGDENEFKDIISDALRKAHCVFYVQGHNKKPDEATATKIKDYLGDWVNVYSIQNVRGAVTDYDEEEERNMLLNENVLKNGALIENRFKEILNRVYKGNIPLQALLAMCSKAAFSPQRQDLLKTQQKLLDFFGSKDAIYKFSEFQNIIDLIETKSTNFKLEIANSNRQKMYSLANGVIQSVNKLIKDNQEKADDFENSLRTFKRDISSHYNYAQNSIRTKVPTSLFTQFNQLQQSLYEIIDDDKSASEQKKVAVDSKVADFERNLSSNLSLIVNYEIESLKRKVEQSKRSLEAFPYTHVDITINSPQVDIDMEDLIIAIEELDIHFDDVTGFLAAVASGALVGAGVGAGAGAGIGAVIGAIGYGVKTLFGDHRKGRAKSLIAKTIATSSQKANSEVEKLINAIIEKLNNSETKLSKLVENEIDTFDKFNHDVEGLKISIYKYEQKVKYFEYEKL